MLEKLTSFSIFVTGLIFFVLFFLVAILFKGPGYSNYYYALVDITSFLFGIFISFSISNSQTKMNSINELLKIDEADFLLIYKLTRKIDEDITNEYRKLLDKHYIDQVDYRLYDYRHSSGSFYEIYDFFLDQKTKKPEVSNTLSDITSLLNEIAKSRKQVETYVQQSISKYEWFSLLGLLGLLCFFILDFNTGSFVSALLSATLATTAFVLTLFLRDLNRLIWQKNRWTWEPLYEFFQDVDLMPYFPKPAISNKEIVLAHEGKVRVANFPHAYPDLSGKTIEIWDLSEKRK